MTTHTALGIDEATFTASLRVIGHPWRAGLRCYSCFDHLAFWSKGHHLEHDIPIPAVTDELVMWMLDYLCPQGQTSRLSANAWDLIQAMAIGGKNIRAAIIRATAALC